MIHSVDSVVVLRCPTSTTALMKVLKKTNKCDYLHENTLCKDRQLGSNFLVAQRPSVTAGCLSWQPSVWILETPAKIMPVLARSLSIIQNLLNVTVDRIHQNRSKLFYSKAEGKFFKSIIGADNCFERVLVFNFTR